MNERFAKAYNRMSKCHIALGDLAQASISLQKAIELEPGNQANKKDQKHLADLKIIESLVQKAVKEENFDKAVTNLSQLLQDCKHAVGLVALKIECLMRAFKFEEASTYSAQIQKSGSELGNHPLFLMWRGKTLIYTGAEVLGKKHLQQAMQYDPDLTECMQLLKEVKKAAAAKEEAAAIFKEGRYEEAIEAFEACLELDPLNSAYNSTLLLNTAIA